ncbi:MAG: TIM barrel protein, partial [Phycisphaerae bacterium]|nr:TIM barrel protein [Phycisphaerae bacterium]
MRLGGYFGAKTIEELEPLCAKLDAHGLSAISAPAQLADMTDDECAAYGERARGLGMIIGEVGMWQNLMTPDAEKQAERIGLLRTMLSKADAMGCLSVVTLVGTKHECDAALAPHPYMYTDECKAEFREIVLRILDGLDLETTKYIIEPWTNSFFYQPEDIKAFIDRVGHPSFGLHLDQMNLINQESFYKTTELIHKTFRLLADDVVSVHLKDTAWDFWHMFLKWDEVLIGDGVMDYETYLKKLA